MQSGLVCQFANENVSFQLRKLWGCWTEALGAIEWKETFCQKDQFPLAVRPRHFPFPRLLGFSLSLQIKTLIFLFSNVCYVATKMYL